MSSLEKEFIPYEQALAMKELGFDEPCLSYWDDDKVFELNPEFLKGSEMDSTWLTRPTFSQAFRWFRDKYGLDNAVLKDRFVIETQEDLPTWYYGFNTYEEAELACLRKLIKITKRGNNEQQ